MLMLKSYRSFGATFGDGAQCDLASAEADARAKSNNVRNFMIVLVFLNLLIE